MSIHTLTNQLCWIVPLFSFLRDGYLRYTIISMKTHPNRSLTL